MQIKEILDGKREGESMDKETVFTVADYSNNEKKKLQRRLCYLFIAGLVLFTIYFTLKFLGITEKFPYDFISGV